MTTRINQKLGNNYYNDRHCPKKISVTITSIINPHSIEPIMLPQPFLSYTGVCPTMKQHYPRG